MLGSAPHLRRGALLIRGPPAAAVGPGSAEQRFTLRRVRDTSPYLARSTFGSFTTRSLSPSSA
ncbi:hypothetical protein V1273_005239 [Bradyrhizobium sp. AZCC 1721]